MVSRKESIIIKRQIYFRVDLYIYVEQYPGRRVDRGGNSEWMHKNKRR